MPVFTAIAAFVTAASGYAFLGSVAAFAAKMVLFNGISNLLGNRTGTKDAGSSNAGSRVQLPPATDNKLPVVYGTAFIAPVITDAMISTDQQYMWYVCALAEHTDSTSGSGYTFGDVYWGGKLITFGTGADAAKVLSFTSNTTPAQVDTKVSGKIYIYKFTNGSSSGVNTGGQTAIQILQDSSTGGGIPSAAQWSSTDTMTNAAFMIVRVEYNQDAGTTGLDQLSVKLTNNLTNPGTVINDYLLNVRYGCGIPAAQIDAASLNALNTYSQEQITYVPVGGGSTTQNRYVINGPINTGSNCLANLQQLVDACDSWLQYSELTGKWKVVINKPYVGTLGSLYAVDSSVLIGGIDITPIDLNSTYNSLEVQYPNTNIKDQTDFQIVDLTDPAQPWYDPYLISPNEPYNRLTLQSQVVNNYIQAVYLGVRRLLQSREDLTINCMLDYSGIQIEAGDVVRVTLAEYGWDNKLFRVSQVQEAKLEDGSLGARIVGFEYNSTVYVDNVLNDFVPADNTGLSDPNVIGDPGIPVIENFLNEDGSIAYFTVTSTVPTTGLVLYMDFNYGTTTDITSHKLYRTVSTGNGSAFVPGQSVTITVTDLLPATYYWSMVARNNSSGKNSGNSDAHTWVGPSVSVYDPTLAKGGISGNNVQSGSLYLNNFNPNLLIPELIKSYKYEVSNLFANTVVPPVNLNTLGNISTGNWVTPKYLTGVYSGGDAASLFPFYDGVSSTNYGYQANSIGSLNPAKAAQLIVANGDLNWLVLEYASTGVANIVSNTQILHINGKVQLVSNTDTVIQTLAFISTGQTGFANLCVAKTDIAFSTYLLNANVPQYVEYTYDIIGSTDFTGGGVLIRQFNSANVVATGGSFTLSKTNK